jgi:hypothetical protein
MDFTDSGVGRTTNRSFGSLDLRANGNNVRAS